MNPRFARKRERVATAAGLGLGALLALSAAPRAMAGAVIFNGGSPEHSTVALGVNDQGHLNFSSPSFATSNADATGLAFMFPDGTWRDATAPGCLCEGWGVAVTDSDAQRISGSANVAAGGVTGLTGGVFGATANTATSTLNLQSASLQISHSYGVSLSPNVFQGNVSLTNTGATALTDVVYRRVMDWDVPPNEFNEFVTHSGVEASLETNGGNVRYASDNGFASGDPTASAGWIDYGTVNSDFVDSGPADHGSVFDFAFGDLAPGETRNFNIFYGAFATEAEADAAIGVLKPNLWSYGQSNTDGTPATFLFAFGGVGGEEPGDSPDNPVLPFVPAPGEFSFTNPEPRQWFDPPFAEGFVYTLTDDPTAVFTEVATPPSAYGFGDLTLVVGAFTYTLAPGVVFDFFANGLTDVTSFKIVGLDPVLDVADPAFYTAFPTFLDFTGSPNLAMTYVEASNGVPLPATLLLLVTGLAGLVRARGRG